MELIGDGSTAAALILGQGRMNAIDHCQQIGKHRHALIR
jgi:hypothetical protein